MQTSGLIPSIIVKCLVIALALAKYFLLDTGISLLDRVLERDHPCYEIEHLKKGSVTKVPKK